MENIICAGFPAVVQRLLKLSLEELDCFVVGVIRDEGLAQIVHILETRDFWETGVHHHEKQRDKEVGMMAQDLVCIDAQFPKPINNTQFN